MFGVSGNSHENNTAVGYKSLEGITTATGNTAIGYAKVTQLQQVVIMLS